jgi:hypothetical protein
MTMTHAIDTVFFDAILVPLLRELGLPETLPLAKLSPRMQKWVLGEAACLQRDAMSHSTFALLVEYGDPLTRESYLNINNVDEDDLDAEQESELPHLFQESMIEERVASVMFEIEIDDTLRQLSEGAR